MLFMHLLVNLKNENDTQHMKYMYMQAAFGLCLDSICNSNNVEKLMSPVTLIKETDTYFLIFEVLNSIICRSFYYC